MSVEVHDLVSPKFFEDNLGVIPLNAALVMECLDDEGNHILMTAWTSDATYFALDGMVNSLHRDVLAIPKEYERRHASRKVDENDEEDD